MLSSNHIYGISDSRDAFFGFAVIFGQVGSSSSLLAARAAPYRSFQSGLLLLGTFRHSLSVPVRSCEKPAVKLFNPVDQLGAARPAAVWQSSKSRQSLGDFHDRVASAAI
jgi:hypothetical protein